jgi:subtilisin family serine protease
MKMITLVKSFTIPAVSLLMLVSCNKEMPEQTQNTVESVVTPASNEGNIIDNQYIIVLKDTEVAPAKSYITKAFTDRDEKEQFMKEKSIIVTNQLNDFLISNEINTEKVIAYYTAAMSGFAITLTEAEYEKLSKSNKISSLEYDRIESLPDFKVEGIDNGGARAQTTPCGITNAGGSTNAGYMRWIWIIDTGVDLDHPDLNVLTSRCSTFAGGTADDCWGHGTHVAGIAAARNNSIGVVGVAANAPIVGVKVFGCSGGSATSTILSGFDYVATLDIPGDVVNVSLGGYYGSSCSLNSSYRTILTSLSNDGVLISVAAGNNSADATLYQPACVNATNLATIANMTCWKTLSSSSNHGAGCDYIATGNNVYSTYKDGLYAHMSGTSMAAPHVAGIMNIRNGLPASNGTISANGAVYPIAVK